MRLLVMLIGTGFTILHWLIIFRVIISWIKPDFNSPQWRQVLKFVYSVTEPILRPIRELLPTGKMGIDLSPIIALFALMIIRNFVMQLLRGLIY